MPPRLERAPKRRKRRQPERPTRAPVTDVQSSGGDYGLRKAVRYKRTTDYRQNLGAAKPTRVTDVSSTRGYDVQRAVQFRRGARKAIHRATRGKPFDPYYAQGAINLGYTGYKNRKLHQTGGVFFVHKKRSLLPDEDLLVRPKTGGKIAGDLTPAEMAAENANVMGDAIHAPALKILGATATPLHAIAGTVKGIGPGRGIHEKTLFGDVLRDRGVPNIIAGPAGFVADVAADPVTWTTFGAGSLARKAAQDAAHRTAREVERQAAAAAKRAAAAAPRAPRNATPQQILRHERRVASAAKAAGDAVREQGATRVAKASGRAAAGKSTVPGLAVRFAGREVPGVREATSQVTRAAQHAATKPGGRQVARAAAAVKGYAGEVRPTLRPPGVSEAEHVATRQAARQARGATTQGVAQAQREARGLKQAIGPENYEKVIDAVERGRIGSLPPELRQPAVVLRSRFRQASRERRRAGLGEGVIRDYFPHAQEEELLKGLGIVEGAAASRPVTARGHTVSRPTSSRRRTQRGTIAELNPQMAAEGTGRFSTDVPLVHANYHQETAKIRAGGRLLQRVAAAGRPFHKGARYDREAGDRVYHLGFASGGRDIRSLGRTKQGGEVVLRGESKSTFGLREVDEAEEARALAGKGRSGQYVVLNKQAVDKALVSASPAQSADKFGVAYDKFTRTWKLVATGTPGFHARNMVGDLQMGYLAQPGHRIPTNVRAAWGAIRELSKQERAQLGLRRPSPSGRTIKVGGESVPVEDFLAQAQAHGVIRSGYVGRELEDLAAGTTKGTRRVKGGKARDIGTHVKRWMDNREDLMRLATFKHSLDEGMPAAQAADRAAHFHIDYGDLTEFERHVGRRVAPFYTFSARAIPMHAKALVQTPGKFAAYEKARGEVAGATGHDRDSDRGLLEFQQRQAPFTIGGRVVSDALPLTVLNELPAGLDPGAYLSELGQFAVGMANPAGKWPIELIANRNLFLRRDVEDENAPLVAAPAWVRGLPKGLKQQFGVTEDFIDQRTGKKVLGWKGKPDYIARQTPGVFAFAQQLMTEGANRRGQDPAQRALAFTAGVRVEPYDPKSAEIQRLLKTRRDINKEISALRQQGKANGLNAKFRQLDATKRLLEFQVRSLSGRRGDREPFFKDAKPPQKVDVSIKRLEAQATAMRKRKPGTRGAANDGSGTMTEEYQALRDRINDLRRSKGPRAKSLRRRPDTPEQKVAKRLDERLSRLEDPGAAAQERLDRRLSRLRG